MSDRPEYIKCARVVEAEDPNAEYEFMYEVKWVGRPDDPTENTWEREAVFQSSAQTIELVEKFWDLKPEPLSEPNREGQYGLGSMFEASPAYLALRRRLVAAACLDTPRSQPRASRTGSASAARANKRIRSPSTSDDDAHPTNRRREAAPPVDEGYRPLSPLLHDAPRPMIRPSIGSVLTFQKGKAVIQDKNRQIQDARLFRLRGGLFLQQHLRKDRERRLAEAKKLAEAAEAAKAAAEEARRVAKVEAERAAEEGARRVAEELAEELAEAEEAERIAEEARLAEETARFEAEAKARVARAAEWSAPRSELPKPPSPPSLKELLAGSLEDDDLPDFEDDEEKLAVGKPDTPPHASIFGAPSSLLDGKPKTAKKADPYYWAKKMDEERKQKELLSRHPILKLEVNGSPIQVFITDIFNESPRSLNTPTISTFAGSIIDTVSTQQEVDAAITGVERGWTSSKSVARLAAVSNVHWAALEVLALQLLVDGKVIISSENEEGWKPIIFSSEEEGIFHLLGAPDQLANYKATLLMTMVKSST